LRRRELVALRLGNFNLAEGSITVRGGKGDKDRVTCLPVALRDEVTRQIERSSALHAQDCAGNLPAIFVPPEVERKYPRAGLELRNFWFFPAKGLSRDPRSGIVRRHHIHEDSLAKQLRPAARRAGILRRVNCHAFRHSFATQFLLNGGTLHELKELLGHASIQTTEVYLHCLPRLGARITSPLDVEQSLEKIIRGTSFESAPATVQSAKSLGAL
jgi:site-specific recombinase XerD